MEKYTIEDLANISNLTTRTIRNYINLKILKGNKEDNKWVFSEEECLNFFNNQMVKHSIEAKAFSLVIDEFNSPSDTITSILYLDVDRIDLKTLMNKINTYENIKFKLDKKGDKYRIIFISDLDTTKDFIDYIK